MNILTNGVHLFRFSSNMCHRNDPEDPVFKPVLLLQSLIQFVSEDLCGLVIPPSIKKILKYNS